MRFRENRLKRASDVVVAGAVLVVSFPVQAIVASAIRCLMGSPALFRQPRLGKDEVIFESVKFRSMPHPDAMHVNVAERLTRLGQFLRSTSLDELPTLWNVGRGDMSLVGPRPLLVEYLPLYTPEQARRHEVRPGVTGHAQVSARNALSWRQKFLLDVKYGEHQSVILDLRNLAITLLRVLRREGINAIDGRTVAGFTGAQDEAIRMEDRL